MGWRETEKMVFCYTICIVMDINNIFNYKSNFVIILITFLFKVIIEKMNDLLKSNMKILLLWHLLLIFY